MNRPQNTQGAHRVVMATISVIAILFFIAVLSVRVVTTMRNAANDIDAKRTVEAITAAVSSAQARLSATVRDNAVWDDAYGAVRSEKAVHWIDNNWGTPSADYPLYDGVIVLDQNGKQIAAYKKGREFDALSSFPTELLRQSHQASRAPSATAIVSFSRLDDQVLLMATLAIQPERNKTKTTGYDTLTYFKAFTPDFVDKIAQDFQIKGLSLVDQPDDTQINFALWDALGRKLAFLRSPLVNPGDAIYEQVLPELLALAALFALFLTVVVFFSRVELRRESQRAVQASYDATHDSLTGLLNRAGLIQAVSAECSGSILHLIDLDGFKSVNDAWGHAVGDELLRKVAARLETIEPTVSTIARIGGDEFALIHKKTFDAVSIGLRVVELIKEPFLIDGRTVEIGASVGFAECSVDVQPLDVLRRADVALYHAKENGRGQVSPYGAELDQERENLADAEQRLKEAIRKDEIQVVFQPLISAFDGSIDGVEALARWSPPTGPVSPEVFIPLAERCGLIDALSDRVLRKAIQAVSDWLDLDLSVNVSPIQLCNPNFATEIMAALESERFDPGRLILEVTEGVFISKPDRARRSIVALHAMGVRFAMDDFGTGHASIGTLRQFGFDKVKIDRSLMAGGNDEIVRATIQLATALDIPVTAEGIETEQQAAFARAAGCELLQGYLVGKPMSFQQLKDRLGTTPEAVATA